MVESKSIRANGNGDVPTVNPSAYIDPSAQIIGNVKIGARVYVGPLAVIRADEVDGDGKVSPIEIGDECNVQDGVIIHALVETGVKIGQRTSLAHGCVVHGPCVIGDGCFVGFRAVVYKTNIGDGSFIGAGAIVQGVDLEAEAFVDAGVVILSSEDAAELAGKANSEHRAFIKKIITANLQLINDY